MPLSDQESQRIQSLYEALLKKFPNEMDAPPVGRAIMIIWDADYRIGNGGFNYFFESLVPVSEAIDAYRMLGASDSVEALQTALRVFPAEPPVDWDTGEQRVCKLRALTETYESVFKAFDEADGMYYDCRGALDTKLVQFIDVHIIELDRLLSSPYEY